LFRVHVYDNNGPMYVAQAIHTKHTRYYVDYGNGKTEHRIMDQAIAHLFLIHDIGGFKWPVYESPEKQEKAILYTDTKVVSEPFTSYMCSDGDVLVIGYDEESEWIRVTKGEEVEEFEQDIYSLYEIATWFHLRLGEKGADFNKTAINL